MSINQYISALIQYGLSKGLFEPCDKVYITNRILEVLQRNSYDPSETKAIPLEDILTVLVDDAVQRGICGDDIVSRDLFDTKIMGILTPPPRDVQNRFKVLYEESPAAATDWFYRFSQDTDYIRRYRVQKDLRWKTSTEYGNLDITINLSKPEKDPKAIAAALRAPQSDYPKCQLCLENEGYAGRGNHPARQNHRIIPVKLDGEDWFFQYSPYVYYPEHCIVFNSQHTPMVINRSTIRKLLDFVTVFPHYFIGSNADLPIVGGSILTHEHFQGGRYSFAMERAPIEHAVSFHGFEDISAGIVKWPMSVLRLTGADKDRLCDLADKILHCWRNYTDQASFIYAWTENTPHNTITPVARRKGTDYELDLVLRNNITTSEHPLGVFHPHEELHHIKKENIGLIEVMGLAVLPARLKQELYSLEHSVMCETPLDGELKKHQSWVNELKQNYVLSPENIDCILKVEVGKIFAQVLTHAGVFKRTPQGLHSFMKFIDFVNIVSA